ncbi:MAG: glycosyltransferase family 2 protein [Coprococcus sp.]|nr:glycosyltransferase family 2 protein [Coprococcus sp.]
MNKVVVLMSTYNGEKYIEEQLYSILSQSDVDIKLIIRDDGSNDSTIDIIRNYMERDSRIKLIIGENYGPAFSFWNLLQSASDCDYYAFSDQDDVWDKDKLKIAIDSIKCNKEIPALYYSNTRLVNSDNTYIIQSKHSSYESIIPTFSQLVMENNAVGCTMVWNRKLQGIAREITPKSMRMHDHLLFLICKLCGGFVFHDKTSHINYRQHNTNVIGGINSKKKYAKSIKKYLVEDSGLALQALQLENIQCDLIVDENLHFLKQLRRYKYRGKGKWYIYKKVKQNGFMKNIAIWGMIMLNRF